MALEKFNEEIQRKIHPYPISQSWEKYAREGKKDGWIHRTVCVQKFMQQSDLWDYQNLWKIYQNRVHNNLNNVNTVIEIYRPM